MSRSTTPRSRFALALLFGLSCASTCHAEETWVRFRGPNGSGVPSEQTETPTEIGPETNVLWKTSLPPGHSSPILTAKQVFVTAVNDERLYTIALDRVDGSVLWQKEARHAGLEEIHSIGSHAQPTPATDGETVVSFFGSCGLFCYDLDGALRWERPMGPYKNTYGAASSPIIVGDLVISCQDHDIDSYLIAVDKQTGNTVWKTERAEFPRGFSSPIIWNVDGRLQVVVAGAIRVVGYDLKSGKEIWTVRGIARIANAIPVIGDENTLFVSEWAPGGGDTDRIQADPFEDILTQYDKNQNTTVEQQELPPGPLKSRFSQIDRDKSGEITRAEYEWMRQIFHAAHNIVVAIKPGGQGDVTDTHVLWTQKKFLPYVPSPVYYDGFLFMVKNGGIASSLDARTGERLKNGRVAHTKNYYSSPVIADGKIYLINQQGELTVLSAEPKWKVLATAQFGEEAFATPAISRGNIYLRTAGNLYCFGLKE